MGKGALKKAEFREPMEELDTANKSYWDNKLSELLFNKDRADELIQNTQKILPPQDINIINTMSHLPPEVRERTKETYMNGLNSQEKAAVSSYENAKIFMDNSYQSLMGTFNQAYKYGDEDTKKQLEKVSEKFQPIMRQYQESGDLNNFSQGVQSLITNMNDVTTGEHAPRIYVPVEEFSINKTSETLSNVALHAYKKFGEKAPIISVENPPYGGAISTGEDLKNLIVETREKFTKNLMGQGKTKGEAERAAEKLIGATWDTSHISMIRKQGFGKEKITEETKKIAPYVKHVHYNDNFGHTHTDLPPGMGDVPLKDVMNELNKENFGGKMIFEGGNFFQHFQTTPHPFVMEGSGSPLYAMEMSPYWNQMSGAPAGYMSAMGDINPPTHHSLYGAGFSNLPSELGGNIPGQASRMTGTPMA